MSNNKRRRRQRQRLFEQSPFCVYCDVPLILYPLAKHERAPDNYATLDHVRSRLHPERTAPAYGETRHVLACNKCNRELGAAEEAALPIEEKWRRAGRPRKTTAPPPSASAAPPPSRELGSTGTA